MLCIPPHYISGRSFILQMHFDPNYFHTITIVRGFHRPGAVDPQKGFSLHFQAQIGCLGTAQSANSLALYFDGIPHDKRQSTTSHNFSHLSNMHVVIYFMEQAAISGLGAKSVIMWPCSATPRWTKSHFRAPFELLLS